MKTSNELYYALTKYGEYWPLNIKNKVNIDQLVNKLNKYKWIQYNPTKDIARKALSITSLDGGMSGVPDLDSLLEFWKRTGEWVDETEMDIKTEIYPLFEKWLDPIEKYICRTHIIKLEPGGFFPAHRDCRDLDIRSFRLFVPLNYSHNGNFFILDNKKIDFTDGQMYFFNECLTHTVFNASMEDWYFIVINVKLTEESVTDTLKHIIG